MHLTDPIADMLTRIRNGNMARHTEVKVPFSKIKEEGNIRDIVITLKYMDGDAVIKGLKRISKPGRRVYTSVENLPKVLGGLGIAIVSTPKGVITDKECRKHSVGGEVLCYVW